MRWTGVLLGIALVVAGLTAVEPTAAQAPPTIKVGAVVPLTGRYAAGGAQVKAGYEFAVEDTNRAGGVMVREVNRRIPLELVLLDDESDPTKTVARLETLFASHQVVAYLGGFGSDLHAAAASIAEKNRVPYLGVAFALHKIHQQGFRYLFSPFPKSPDLTRETYRFLNASIPEAQRPRRVAIFKEKTDWGDEMGGLWATRAPEFGYQAVVQEEYAVGSRDFSDIILRARAAGAEAVFAIPTPPDGFTLVRQMKELAFNAKFYLFIRAADAVVWGRNLGKDGDYFSLAPGWHNAVKYPGVRELNEKHARAFGRPADVITGPAYANVQILADAITRAGTLDRAKIRDAVAATQMTTVMGPVRFRPDGTGMVVTVFLQWQNGRQELVWPKEFATAPLQFPAPPWGQR
ncbi:MAG: amino acid ABC transporter substrate-binding protein [Armatimonadota bacterium]|nr:amino acid ABC transporter substrate-binding protein [Armatimonadota bacterium]MDR7486416.1 amino acid ABC transporter substrate-binding protein [Armatimonadota bacterium]MDR7532549.1 amino acid ABC transporter substrate-binding protein [Armatimonadota bacterium]